MARHNCKSCTNNLGSLCFKLESLYPNVHFYCQNYDEDKEISKEIQKTLKAEFFKKYKIETGHLIQGVLLKLRGGSV